MITEDFARDNGAMPKSIHPRLVERSRVFCAYNPVLLNRDVREYNSMFDKACVIDRLHCSRRTLPIGIDRPMIADALCFAARNRISITILTDSRAWTSNAEGFNHPEIRANIPTIIIGSSRIGLKARKKRAKEYCRSKCDKYPQGYHSINILFRIFLDLLIFLYFYLEGT